MQPGYRSEKFLRQSSDAIVMRVTHSNYADLLNVEGDAGHRTKMVRSKRSPASAFWVLLLL
jgi:hypothetical protein